MKLRKSIFVLFLFIGGCNFKSHCYEMVESRAEGRHGVLCNFRGWRGCEPWVRENVTFKELFRDIEISQCHAMYGPR